MAVYLLWETLILYNFFNCIYVGPGTVPIGWEPENKEDIEFLQYCAVCEGYKPPRSHHCRKCQRCIMKMDHHCPWINNCVGHKNHLSFTAFLLYAPVGCVHSLCVIIPSMYWAMYRAYYHVYGNGDEPEIFLTVNAFIAGMFAVGLAIGVVLAVGGLLFLQVRSILKNETGVETWIKDKANYRRRDEDEEFVYPYNLGWWANWCMVCYYRRRPDLDGFWWPVREGCHQHTFTVEQMLQKRDKRDHSVEYLIQEPYSGSVCPFYLGPRICFGSPCTDEPRIKVCKGDHTVITRWKRHWLYGTKVLDTMQNDDSKKRVRGWFPRRCAIEVIDDGFIDQPELDGHMGSGENCSNTKKDR